MLLKSLIWIGLLPAAIYLYCQIYFPEQPAARFSHYLIQFFYLLFATLSLGSAALQEKHRSVITIWSLLAAGTGIWTFTTLLELLELVLKQPNYGTVADGFWIAGYLPILSGMRTAADVCGGASGGASRNAGRLWLVFSGTVLVLGSVFGRSDSDSTFLFLLALVYHVADILLTYWAIVATLGKDEQRLQPAMKCLLMAFLLMYFVNLIVILQRFTSPFHLWSGAGFSLTYLLLFSAGRRSGVTRL